jgi:hypothetical protein
MDIKLSRFCTPRRGSNQAPAYTSQFMETEATSQETNRTDYRPQPDPFFCPYTHFAAHPPESPQESPQRQELFASRRLLAKPALITVL